MKHRKTTNSLISNSLKTNFLKSTNTQTNSHTCARNKHTCLVNIQIELHFVYTHEHTVKQAPTLTNKTNTYLSLSARSHTQLFANTRSSQHNLTETMIHTPSKTLRTQKHTEHRNLLN